MQTLIKQFESINIKSVLKKKDQVYDLRREYKFIIPMTSLEQVLTFMKNDFYCKCCDDSHLFHYRNQYFDTSDLRFFHMHRQGKYNRIKVRIREYKNGIPARYLECKEKIKGLKNKKKRKILIDGKVASPFSDADFINDLLRKYDCDASQLNQSMDVTYSRLHFMSRDDLLRVTIDFDLKVSLPDGKKQAMMSDFFIMELKANYHPKKMIQYLRRQLGVRQESFSKYCLSICALHPSIKSNRWKGTIKKYF